MDRLQVKYGNRWKWGIVEYETLEAAENRVAELNRVGITARIKRAEELYR